MPRTTTDPNVRIPKPPRDPADVQAQARAFADRAQRVKGEDWTTAYVRTWRRLSGLPRTTPGPVPVWLPATTQDAARHARRRQVA